MACKRVLSDVRLLGDLNDSTRSYLNCWLSDDPIDAAESRFRVLQMEENRGSRLVCESCNFRRLADRASILHYVITGELIPVVEDEQCKTFGAPSCRKDSGRKRKPSASRQRRKLKRGKADCGSMVFWNTPPNSPPLESDVFFNTISMETLLEHWNEGESRNVVDAMIQIKLGQLYRLREDLLDRRIEIELRCDFMAETNDELISELSALRPNSVSWSNVMDYWSGQMPSFHNVARRIGPSSRHFGYSINWVTAVYGASIVDYLPESERPAASGVQPADNSNRSKVH